MSKLIKLLHTSLFLLFINDAIAQSGSAKKSLSQLEFDKGDQHQKFQAEHSPNKSITEAIEAINNESQIKNSQKAVVPGDSIPNPNPESNLSKKAPVEPKSNQKNSINRLD